MRRAALIFVAVTFLAACSASSLDTAATDTTTTTETEKTTTSTTTSTTEPEVEVDPEQDLAVAEEIVLKADDFGPEWSALPVADVDESDFDDAVAVCLDDNPEAVAFDAPTAVSDAFSPGDDRGVEAEVVVAASESELGPVLDGYLSDPAVECFGDAYRDFVVQTFESGGDFRSDLVVAEATTERLDVAPLGDAHLGIRYTIPITAPDLYAPIIIDLTVTQVGRTLILAIFTNTLEPFPEADSARLVEAMVNRVPADL